ncbi:hypothetical protein EDC18_10986 [Natranaerovirga pectinivora]|uniref:Uncharacterized protein n=1 Tax=Natranaerovirga pectinivora TaxID=682400 RepID=A0A4R3MIH1_9FIRM|nr:hypothetical protein EDC18_10986 [Natranaerovirga pectinivora]
MDISELMVQNNNNLKNIYRTFSSKNSKTFEKTLAIVLMF